MHGYTYIYCKKTESMVNIIPSHTYITTAIIILLNNNNSNNILSKFKKYIKTRPNFCRLGLVLIYLICLKNPRLPE